MTEALIALAVLAAVCAVLYGLLAWVLHRS